MPLPLAEVASSQYFYSALLFVMTGFAVWAGWTPVITYIRRQEVLYAHVLQYKLLMNVRPRLLTLMSLSVMVLLSMLLLNLSGSVVGAALGVLAGVLLPRFVLSTLRSRHLARLESQLIMGIQTLASGVRAGLNLVQSMQLVARDGPPPLRHEFAHMLREYEYGVPLDSAMSNAAARIGSGNFRLLFSALQTHRDRGGDLGETLDRIADSIREIQRLEKRVQTLTAQGRATARWLGAMPILVAGLYYIIDPDSVSALFNQSLGNIILLAVIVLDILGFVWIKKIVNIDV